MKPTVQPRQIAEVLKKTRIRKKMTMAQVCAETGFSVGFLSQVERGKRHPSLLSLIALAGAYRVQLSHLIKQAEGYHD